MRLAIRFRDRLVPASLLTLADDMMRGICISLPFRAGAAGVIRIDRAASEDFICARLQPQRVRGDGDPARPHYC